MLDRKKNYVGITVSVFGTKFEEVNNKEFKIIEQLKDENDALIFGLNVKHPQYKKGNLYVSETNVSTSNIKLNDNVKQRRSFNGVR